MLTTCDCSVFRIGRDVIRTRSTRFPVGCRYGPLGSCGGGRSHPGQAQGNRSDCADAKHLGRALRDYQPSCRGIRPLD